MRLKNIYQNHKTMTTELKEKLSKLVFEGLGAASVCWTETPKGVFDDTQARKVGDNIMTEIGKEIDAITSQPWLGNATTGELINELAVRAEIHGYKDYKTTMSDEDYAKLPINNRPMKDPESDLVSFGQYLLSPERRERFAATTGTMPLEDRLSQVHDADLSNWRDSQTVKG